MLNHSIGIIFLGTSMTIDINAEISSMRASLLIITNNVETHSALSDVPKEILKEHLENLRAALESVLHTAAKYRKP